MKKIVGFALLFLINLSVIAQVNIYVSPVGNNNAAGSKEQPVATIKRAQELVRELKAQDGLPDKGVRIMIEAGEYTLDESLVFTPEDNGEKDRPVIFQGAEPDGVLITAGRKITNWRKVKNNHWVASVPEVRSGDWYFRQLFAGEKRLTRARIPNAGFLKTKGPLTKYADSVGKYTWNQKMREEQPGQYWESRCGFQFRKGDIQQWENWDEAEILTYHSWESSWQTIREIDTEKQDVYFNSPCRYPIGTFGKEMRYRVENIPAAMDQPGEWYLDGKKGEVHYLTAEGEDPNTMEIYAPYLNEFMSFQGDSLKKVQYLSFKNISFKYARYNLGIYDMTPQWPQEIQKGLPQFPDHPRGGYTDAQAAPRSGQAVELVNAEHIQFENCRFNHVGAYAMRIGERCFNIKLQGCEMFDLGGGGLLLGRPDRNVVKDRIPFDLAPGYNIISNCYIHDGGKVHPAAVGLCVMQSHNNLIEHCEIGYTGNSGISNGWCWTDHVETYNFNNRFIGNYIHHTSQTMGDAAGYYNNGASRGTILQENFIDQIVKGPDVHGVVDGMGMDSHSRYIYFERNVIGKTSGKVTSFARQTGPWNFTWKDNNFNWDIERPVFAHSPELDHSEFTIVADFKLPSTFLDLSGWTERQWVLSKNGKSDADGYYGMLVEGGKAIAYLNVGGGKENNHQLVVENDLQEDAQNRFAISYDSKIFRFYVNGAVVEKKIAKTRKPGNGKLVVAHLGANCLRYSVDQLLIFDEAIKDKKMSALNPESTNLTFQWEQPQLSGAKVDFEQIKKEAGIKAPYKSVLKQ
ncbi:right-handed parallel beta-helix repeat-containing protein [Sunxiuqinia elliptica]|uniref:Concanavalin A-like lectin/glucanases superfamily protein n=1 Tax=Sunxiuqinia elliptica TaxID=655355 RepID=A0A1I2GVL0_9BACT|nr:right-handed parallel beta-helix repeat-containing protein [Sunxiuqinia elliptica]SFF20621.1 Concanavalin A-like lectin/glucanases superfamily protein [Sunxiuqinia elliptica]